MASSFYRSVFFPFFITIVVIQGVHTFEHVIQLVQVYLFDVPDDEALGFLGYLIQFNDTEEWLHLVFNSTYLLALFILALPLWSLVPHTIPIGAFAVFAAGGLGLETWHVVEHSVIISNVIENHGCPCPGIGDVALGITDTVLHFMYNTVAYAATVTPFWFVMRGRPPAGSTATAVA